MSVDVDTQPVGLEVVDDSDDMVHTFCCSKTKAICGEVMDVVEWRDDLDHPDCVVCYDLQDKPCGAPFCRLRSWWRDRMGPP